MEITEKFKVLNQLGFHLRAAAKFATVRSRFKCGIQVRDQHAQADGKSVMSLLTLAAALGAELTITFDGEDASDAYAAVQNLFLTKFEEN